jgi:hypothetical protein
LKPKKKIPKTFISFLLASILIWLLITLSKEYITTISFPVEFGEISQNKLLLANQTKVLEIVVKTNGFKILRTRFNTKSIRINVNTLIRKKGTTYYLLLKSKKQSIKRQLPSGISLQEIIKDTLFVELGSLVTKKLAVRSNLKISYHIGYDLSEKISLKPDSILVSGPENYISKIKDIELLPIVFEDLKVDFVKKVAIKVPEGVKNLKFNVKEVTVSGKIEKFTEGILNVPFKIINVPKGFTINTLEKKIQVSYIVGLSSFHKIDENSFQIECDYKMSASNNLGYLIPKVVRKSSEVKSYKLIPNEINFLIQI